MSCIQKVVVRGEPARGWRAGAVIRPPAKSRSLLAARSRNNVRSGRPRPGATAHARLLHDSATPDPADRYGQGAGLQRSAPAPSIRARNKSECSAIRNGQQPSHCASTSMPPALNLAQASAQVAAGRALDGARAGLPHASLVAMQERTCSGAISPADLRCQSRSTGVPR